MTVDQPKRNEEAAVRWVEEFYNRRNAAVVDELIAPDCESHQLWHNAYLPTSLRGGTAFDVLKRSIDYDFMGLEHPHTTIDQTIAAGDKVVAVMTTTGTRNGKQVSFIGIDIYRFANEKIAEMSDQWDRLGVYQQLGILPDTSELLRQSGMET